MDRRGRTGQVVDLVDLDVERQRHVVAHQLEAAVVEQRLDVVAGAGEEVVDADHVGAHVEQPLAEMRAEESGAAGDQDALFEMHECPSASAAFRSGGLPIR